MNMELKKKKYEVMACKCAELIIIFNRFKISFIIYYL
jgi:hypothetical protein